MTPCSSSGSSSCELQLLGTRFVVQGAGDGVDAILDWLPRGAVHDDSPQTECRIDVRRDGPAYLVRIDDGPPHEERNAGVTAEWVYVQLYERALENHGRGAVLEAACLELDGRRLLVAGALASGRNRLALELLRRGARLESDRLTLVDADGACGVALSFLQDESDREGDPLCRDLPCIRNSAGDRMLALQPRHAGADWRIRHGPVDAIFSLDHNRGGQTRSAPQRKLEMVEELMHRGLAWRSSRPDWIPAIGGLVESADCWRLFYGDPAAAVDAIRATAERN